MFEDSESAVNLLCDLIRNGSSEGLVQTSHICQQLGPVSKASGVHKWNRSVTKSEKD